MAAPAAGGGGDACGPGLVALNRLQRTLESANIKLGAVASEVWGASGQAILTALVQGEDDPAVLADLAQGTLRDKLEALAQALDGRVRPYHRVLIAQIMRHIRFLEEAIATLDAEIAQAAAPFEAAVRLLLPVPSFAVVSARAVLAEIGVDISRPRQYPSRSDSPIAGGHHGGGSVTRAVRADLTAPACHHEEVPRAGLCR